MENEERRERDMEITTWDIFYEYHLRRQIGINLEISAFQGWVSQHGQVGMKPTTVYFRGVLSSTGLARREVDSESSLPGLCSPGDHQTTGS